MKTMKLAEELLCPCRAHGVRRVCLFTRATTVLLFAFRDVCSVQGGRVVVLDRGGDDVAAQGPGEEEGAPRAHRAGRVGGESGQNGRVLFQFVLGSVPTGRLD